MGVMTKKYQLYIDETGNRKPETGNREPETGNPMPSHLFVKME